MSKTNYNGVLPIQTIIIDKHGRQRFEENPLISELIEGYSGEYGEGLNAISFFFQDRGIDNKYYEQLTQLIGYSVSGFGGLSTTTDETWDRVCEVSGE